MLLYVGDYLFFFSSRRRHTRCALVTGVQTCALPISLVPFGAQPGDLAQFGRADRGEILRVAEEKSPGRPKPFVEADGPLRAVLFEIGRDLAELYGHVPSPFGRIVLPPPGQAKQGLLWPRSDRLENGRASCRDRVCPYV